jgi:hypothetical protein
LVRKIFLATASPSLSIICSPSTRKFRKGMSNRSIPVLTIVKLHLPRFLGERG